MGWENSNLYEYHPERGLYYHEVTSNLICGSQPQTREDIEHLHFQENVTNIVNLQVRSVATLYTCVYCLMLHMQGTYQVHEAVSLRRLAAWKPTGVPHLLKKAMHAEGLYLAWIIAGCRDQALCM